MINIEFDQTKISETKIRELSEAIQKIVSGITNIEDVFVYANHSEITLKIAPVEIFVRMSKNKIVDADALVNQIREKILEWKKKSAYEFPINLTLIPMDWKVVIGI